MKKYKVVLTIVFSAHFLIFLMMLCLAYRIFYYQDSQKTVELSGTVSYVHVTGDGMQKSVQIYTQEYSSYLTILFQNTGSRIDVDQIAALQKGDRIQFVVSSNMDSLLNAGGFVEIVSLRTEDGVVFTIEQYNQFMREDMAPDLRSAAIMTITMFCLALGFGLSMIKDKKQAAIRRKTEDDSVS